MAVHDTWASGDPYEAYVGRWSRLVAAPFVDWLARPAGGDWVDVGCGTGALSDAILRRADPRSVRGIDASAGFIAHARAQIADARAGFEVGDAQALGGADASADTIVSGLLLNFVPRLDAALAGTRRLCRRGGVVAAYVWDYAGRMQLMRHFWNAAAALDARAHALDEGRRFPLCTPAALEAAFVAAGFADVRTRALDIDTTFRDFDDYWTPFLGGQGPAPSYAQSLDEPARAALRERLHASLPFAIDGSIPLVARAWAVAGRGGG